MPSRIPTCVAAIMIMVLAPVAADGATYKFCNRTGRTIRAAGVSSLPNRPIDSKGWFSLAPGECRVVWDQIASYRSYYGYATAENGQSWGGKVTFCVHPSGELHAEEYDSDFDDCDGELRDFQELVSKITGGPFQVQPQNLVWIIGGLPPSPQPALGPARSLRDAPPVPPPTHPYVPPPAPAAPAPQSPSYVAPPCGCSKVFEGRCVGVCSGSCPSGSHCTSGNIVGCYCHDDG